MAFTSDLGNGIMAYDNAEDIVPVEWGGDINESYAQITGGNQSFDNPHSGTGIWVSTDYARVGSKSYKLKVTKRTDKYNSCCEWTRSEVGWMNDDQQADSGNEWQFSSVSTLIDPSVNLGAGIRYQIAFDHKEAPNDDDETPFWLGIQAGNYVVAGRNVGNQKSLGPVTKGIWEDWVLHRTWSSNGFIRLYRNGSLVWSKTGDVRVAGHPICRIQHGIYKWAWQNQGNQGEGPYVPPADDQPITMYIDEIRFGNSSASLEDFFIDGVTPPSNTAPVAYAGADKTVTLPTDSVTLTGTATDADGTIAGVAWTKISGGNATITSPTSLSTTVTALVEGSYVFRLTATDDDGATHFDNVGVTVSAASVTPPVTGTIKIDSGRSGTPYSGWDIDKYYSGGTPYNIANSIAGTTADPVYQTHRFGNSTYTIPVSNGTYTVKLHFAETFHNSVGARVFNVKINGTSVLTNYDILAATPKNTAVVKTFSTTVTTGSVVVQFTTVRDNAIICGIEIVPSSVVPPDTNIYVKTVVEGSTVINGAARKTATITYMDNSITYIEKK